MNHPSDPVHAATESVSAPPRQASTPATQATAFPWLLVSAWMLGAVVMFRGAMAALPLLTGWSEMVDRSIIEPGSHPLNFVPFALGNVAAGVLLILRKRWVFLAIAAWMGGLLYMASLGRGVSVFSPLVSLRIAEQLFVLGFCLVLQMQGRLK